MNTKFGIKMMRVRGQIILEYILIIGLVVGVLIAMSPLFRRAVQGFVRTVADQVGNQVNAEQFFDEGGFLINSFTTTRAATDKHTRDILGIYNYTYNDRSDSLTETWLNLGFQPNE